MLRSSDYLSWSQAGITWTLRLLALAVFFLSGCSDASEVECSQQGKYRVCEIKEAVPAAPFEVGEPRDMNFSSPSKKLHGGLKQSGNENRSIQQMEQGGSRFEATIIGEATSEQREAVNFCMELAALNWISSVVVRVLIRFEDLGVQNVLGSAQPSRNWIVGNYICPVALAKAVLGKDLNNDTTSDLKYDIWMTLNSEARWYSGSDARPPFGRYDLVTVCLHETYHGLFMSGGNVGIDLEDDGSYSGFFYNTQFRGRFDAFMANQDKCQIIGYESNGTRLGAVLTGNNLWFAEGQRRVGRLHAPRPYKVGSSLYHLSEWEYGEGTDDNDLMTPSIGSNYGQHNGGKVLSEMQKLVIDIEGTRGAEECEEIREPQMDDGLIDQGNGGAGNTNTNKNDSDGEFTIKIGDSEISGWIVVGAGIGGVLLLVLLVGCVVRSSVMEKRKAAAAKKERRRRRAQERIDFEKGNGGGVV